MNDPFDTDSREDGCDDLPTRDDLNYLAEQAAGMPCLDEVGAYLVSQAELDAMPTVDVAELLRNSRDWYVVTIPGHEPMRFEAPTAATAGHFALTAVYGKGNEPFAYMGMFGDRNPDGSWAYYIKNSDPGSILKES